MTLAIVCTICGETKGAHLVVAFGCPDSRGATTFEGPRLSTWERLLVEEDDRGTSELRVAVFALPRSGKYQHWRAITLDFIDRYVEYGDWTAWDHVRDRLYWPHEDLIRLLPPEPKYSLVLP